MAGDRMMVTSWGVTSGCVEVPYANSLELTLEARKSEVV